MVCLFFVCDQVFCGKFQENYSILSRCGLLMRILDIFLFCGFSRGDLRVNFDSLKVLIEILYFMRMQVLSQ